MESGLIKVQYNIGGFRVMDYSHTHRIPFHRTINLFIETLTGTCFELRVSPFETVLSVKAKIQRLEGIPISQQHLIWDGAELDDDYCLHDYRIKDSCMLKLVLAMRGGPINTRRIAMDETSLLDMADYIDVNHEDLLEELSVSPTTGKMDNNSQVTLLVYRNGDQINFFRVVDRGDGALTPVSESYSGGSYQEMEDVSSIANKQKRTLSRLMENRITASKMKHLQNRMHDLNVKENVRYNQTPATNYGDHLKQNDKLNKSGLEVPTQSELGPFSDKQLPDLDRKSTRTERLLRVLNESSQKSSTNTSQREKSTSAKTKSPRFSHSMTSKMAFNRHDMYLRSYGLQPTQKSEDSENSSEKSTEMRNSSADVGTSTTITNVLSSISGDKETFSSSKLPYNKQLWSNHSNTSADYKRQRSASRSEFKSSKVKMPTTSNNHPCQSTPHNVSLPSGMTSSQLPPLVSNGERLPTLPSVGRRFSSSYKDMNSASPTCAEYSRASSLNKTKSILLPEYKDITETVPSDIIPMPPNSIHSHEGKLSRGASGKRSERYLPATAMTVSKKVGYETDIPSIDVDCLRMMSRYPQKPSHSPTILPPVRPLVLKKKRCLWCAKKTGLASSYTCRCGKNFCATHRYAETHNCTFDYKSSGRQLLKDNNPIVTAPKLPKI